MNRLMHVCFLISMCAIAVGLSIPARADIPNLWWRPPEVIDSNVASLPSTSGACAVSALGRWWVAYEKGGDIYCADRDTSGGSWRTTRLATGPAVQTEPHIAANDQLVYVVWEDHSGAHPEIWTRNTASLLGWGPAGCLSCDETPSRHPVIDAYRGSTGDPYVAWEDSTAAGFRVIGKSYFGAAQQLSSSLGDAREPSVSAVGGVVWTDYRYTVPQIYGRIQGHPEQRVTFLPFPCRHADIKSGVCQEFDFGPPTILFEGEPHGGGISEVYMAHCDGLGGADMISADDGVSSSDPNLDYLTYNAWGCTSMPWTQAHYFTTWTDHPSGGGSQHWMDKSICCGIPSGNDPFPATGISHSAVGVGEAIPHGGVLELWIENHGGVPTLMARVGRTPDCLMPAITGPRAFLVVPGGTPGNLFRLFNACDGAPLFGDVYWNMDGALDGALTWDPQQGHSGYDFTSNQGEVTFGVSAGGCSQAGDVHVQGCDLNPQQINYPGAKSPDIDGDCEVDASDLAYVESKVGTADFCADLDGSGVVDAADVAIVQATLGQHCSNVVSGVAAGGAIASAPALRVFPNPCQERATFETVAPAGGPPVRIDVIDAGGRRVRTIEPGAGTSARGNVGWDLRDEAGRAVPSGIYFVIARFGAESRRQVLVVY